ncbi:MAG: Secretion system C-terminal sorting domain [Bacteroidota bacterium]|jgi:hypothetical protein
MSKIYNDLKEGRQAHGLAKVAAILIFVLVWILIDKGNIYGQSRSDFATQGGKAVKLDVSDMSQLKAGGRDGGIQDDLSDSDEEDNSFTVFPNPVDGDLVFDFEFTIREGAPYEVHDALGKLVERGILQPGTSEYRIDLKDLVTGLYFIRVDLGGKLEVRRIMKK